MMQYTPLFYAIKNDKIEAATLLLDNNAIPTTELLHRIAHKNLGSLYIDLLLRYGAEWGDILLHVDYMYSDRLTYVALEKGANVNIRDTHDGDTPLHILISNARDPSYHHYNREYLREIFDLFLQHGADINAKNNESITPLHLATTCYMKDILHTLVIKGANINAVDYEGKTPLHYAAEFHDIDLAEVMVLLEHGADIRVRDYSDNTPLHTAINMDRKYLALTLTDHLLDN